MRIFCVTLIQKKGNIGSLTIQFITNAESVEELHEKQDNYEANLNAKESLKD